MYRLQEKKLEVAERNRQDPGSAALLITDGANSLNNRMPFLGPTTQFSALLTQHLQLVLDIVNGTLFFIYFSATY